ncbi:Uridine phosphorylase 1 [Toxocara canis]|uniref:Uridine phosphorylase 1 n=1 Tax=Toxocara canis TaxID=6265 RepID=A0A0B2VJE9_TOXCA|nr:Uridine phosphorylase 1 [Toxocara canis]
MAKTTGGKVPLLNPILEKESEDYLYHFGIAKSSMDLPKLFGDIKYVCCGGSASRITVYAELFAKEIGVDHGKNWSNSDRYVMYKTGPVLWINHGMGVPSLSIMMVETIKLLHYAGASDVTIFRLGTSGGLGVEPGTVVVSSGALNGELEEFYIQYIMGKKVLRPAVLDQQLKEDLCGLAKQLNLPVETGKTLCADDFYEGQARLDGAFCEYTMKDKFEFLERLYQSGVRNIEMEATCFAAMSHRAGIRAAIVCVTLLNRMKGDQVDVEKSKYHEFETRPFKLVTAFIKQQLALPVHGKN